MKVTAEQLDAAWVYLDQWRQAMIRYQMENAVLPPAFIVTGDQFDRIAQASSVVILADGPHYLTPSPMEVARDRPGYTLFGLPLLRVPDDMLIRPGSERDLDMVERALRA